MDPVPPLTSEEAGPPPNPVGNHDSIPLHSPIIWDDFDDDDLSDSPGSNEAGPPNIVGELSGSDSDTSPILTPVEDDQDDDSDGNIAQDSQGTAPAHVNADRESRGTPLQAPQNRPADAPFDYGSDVTLVENLESSEEDSEESSEEGPDAGTPDGDSEREYEDDMINTFVNWCCTTLLEKPREDWADSLDILFDPNSFAYREYLDPDTLQRMKDLCNGVADVRRGGTGYFKPELYRPRGPNTPSYAYDRDISGRVYDRDNRGPNPYDDGPDANYERDFGVIMGGRRNWISAIKRYHFDQDRWDKCDDLLNLTPDRWMDSLPTLVMEIFDPRERGAREDEYHPWTLRLFEAMRNAFNGVPPACIPGQMAPDGSYFEVIPRPQDDDLRREINWVPRMKRDELLASIPDRALHIRMYGRPKPDRRLEEKRIARPVTSRGARHDAADFLYGPPHSPLYVAEDVSESQHGRLERAFYGLMSARGAALREHDAIDSARAEFRGLLARVNKPFWRYMDPHQRPEDDNNREEDLERAVAATVADLERARDEVEAARVRMRSRFEAACGREAEARGLEDMKRQAMAYLRRFKIAMQQPQEQWLFFVLIDTLGGMALVTIFTWVYEDVALLDYASQVAWWRALSYRWGFDQTLSWFIWAFSLVLRGKN